MKATAGLNQTGSNGVSLFYTNVQANALRSQSTEKSGSFMNQRSFHENSKPMPVSSNSLTKSGQTYFLASSVPTSSEQ